MLRVSLFLLTIALLAHADDRRYAEEQVASFERFAKQKVYTAIYFRQLRQGVAGVCETTFIDGRRTVYLDPIAWLKYDWGQRENLIFHELGHCELGLEHNPYKDSVGCPISIMYPTIFGETYCYRINRARYFKQLFENPFRRKYYSESDFLPKTKRRRK